MRDHNREQYQSLEAETCEVSPEFTSIFWNQKLFLRWILASVLANRLMGYYWAIQGNKYLLAQGITATEESPIPPGRDVQLRIFDDKQLLLDFINNYKTVKKMLRVFSTRLASHLVNRNWDTPLPEVEQISISKTESEILVELEDFRHSICLADISDYAQATILFEFYAGLGLTVENFNSFLETPGVGRARFKAFGKWINREQMPQSILRCPARAVYGRAFETLKSKSVDNSES